MLWIENVVVVVGSKMKMMKKKERKREAAWAFVDEFLTWEGRKGRPWGGARGGGLHRLAVEWVCCWRFYGRCIGEYKRDGVLRWMRPRMGSVS